MKSFWRSVLLKTGEYKGKPVPVHMKLEGIETEDFRIWLGLFEETLAELFEPEARPPILQSASRIATSLWFARNPDPFTSPPAWMKRGTEA